jgi:hypothetical protein
VENPLTRSMFERAVCAFRGRRGIGDRCLEAHRGSCWDYFDPRARSSGACWVLPWGIRSSNSIEFANLAAWYAFIAAGIAFLYMPVDHHRDAPFSPSPAQPSGMGSATDVEAVFFSAHSAGGLLSSCRCGRGDSELCIEIAIVEIVPVDGGRSSSGRETE